MASCFASPGFNTEASNAFVATGLVRTRTNLEDDEILEGKAFAIHEVKKLLVNKHIRDAKSLVALFYFFMEKGRFV